MNYLETFHASYERIMGPQVQISDQGNRFFDAFYEYFMENNPTAKKAFENTDMERQKQIIKKSLLFMANFSCCDQGTEFMERIARSHNQHHYNIAPELYDCWLDSMIITVQRFDPEFTQDIDIAWRLSLTPGISYMKYMYDK